MDFTVFDHPDFDRHEQVQFVSDQPSGMRAIIAIHDVTLGPAYGGCLVHPYAAEAEALADALRLSQGMSWQAALAGLALGGAKMVVLAHPRTQKSPAMMRAVGEAVERMTGRFIIGPGAGATVEDMDVVATRTRHVAGHAKAGGDPSPFTAEGLFHCMAAAARWRFGGAGGVGGLRVCVKGLGGVGWRLAALLSAGGARLTVADVRSEITDAAQAQFGATVVAITEAMAADVDVVAPCAMGAELSAGVLSRLRAKVICGAARNQLVDPADGDALAARGITYCPDFIVNAGGLIHSAQGPLALSDEAAQALLKALPRTLIDVLERAQHNRSTASVAEAMARERLRCA